MSVVLFHTTVVVTTPTTHYLLIHYFWLTYSAVPSLLLSPFIIFCIYCFNMRDGGHLKANAHFSFSKGKDLFSSPPLATPLLSTHNFIANFLPYVNFPSLVFISGWSSLGWGGTSSKLQSVYRPCSWHPPSLFFFARVERK